MSEEPDNTHNCPCDTLRELSNNLYNTSNIIRMMLRQFFPNDTSAIINIISKIYSFHTYVPKYDKSKLNEIARTIINNGLFDPVHHRINFPLSDISSVSDQDTINAAIRIITYIATVPALRRLMFINQLSLSFNSYKIRAQFRRSILNV